LSVDAARAAAGAADVEEEGTCDVEEGACDVRDDEARAGGEGEGARRKDSSCRTSAVWRVSGFGLRVEGVL